MSFQKQASATRRATNCRTARAGTRVNPAATPPRRRRRGDAENRAQSSGNIARERGSAPGSTRAPRAFAGHASSCRHLRHIEFRRRAGTHACSTKARGGGARGRRERARARRGAAAAAWKGRATSHSGVRGDKTDTVAHALGDLAGGHESSFMPQHANRGVLKHAARGCGSGRGGTKGG